MSEEERRRKGGRKEGGGGRREAGGGRRSQASPRAAPLQRLQAGSGARRVWSLELELELRSPMEIPPTHAPARRAAAVAQNCINYQQGTPHQMFQVRAVEHASLEVRTAGREGPTSSMGTGHFLPRLGVDVRRLLMFMPDSGTAKGGAAVFTRLSVQLACVPPQPPPHPGQGTRELHTHIDRRLPAQNEGPAEARPSGDPAASTGPRLTDTPLKVSLTPPALSPHRVSPTVNTRNSTPPPPQGWCIKEEALIPSSGGAGCTPTPNSSVDTENITIVRTAHTTHHIFLISGHSGKGT